MRNNLLFIKIADAATFDFNRRELSEYAREKLENCTNEKRTREIILGDAVRRELLAEVNAQDEPLALRERGKPYLPGRKDVGFNISHSGELAVGVLLTVSTEDVGFEIGCDVEKIDRNRTCGRQNRIMKHAFAESERLLVESSSDPAAEFYAVWTRKEAYLKYTGEGIAVSLASVDTIRLPTSCTTETFTLRDSSGEEYVFSVCMPSSCAKIEKKAEFIQ